MRKVQMRVTLTVACLELCDWARRVCASAGVDPDICCLSCLVDDVIDGAVDVERGVAEVEVVSDGSIDGNDEEVHQ